MPWFGLQSVIVVYSLFVLAFKEKSQTKNIRKEMFLNISRLQFIENINFRSLLTIKFLEKKNSLTFFSIFSKIFLTKNEIP